MKANQYRYVFLMCLLFAAYQSAGQGCSDAGFCTLDNFKPKAHEKIDSAANKISIGVSYGKADHSIAVVGNYLAYSRQINSRVKIDAKLTSLAQYGNGISRWGMSDIYLNTDVRVFKKMLATAGLKLPLTDGNRGNDFSLPMDYQSSLGSLDLILGAQYPVGKFQVAIAYQQPLVQNKNRFLANEQPAGSKLSSFQSTNNFKRKGDVLLRGAYLFPLNKKFTVTPSILTIYHLANDSFTDASHTTRSIAGSQGLTVNGNVYLDYMHNARNAFQLTIASPFVVRKTRPDGLTRSFVVNVEYRLSL